MRNHVIIIAEAGVNHNGDFEKAKQLVDAAAEAGADYVKFQTFKADKLVTRDARKAAYQQQNMQNEGDTQYDMLKKLEMPEAWHYSLKDYAHAKGIKFMSTGFDEDSIDFLVQLGQDFLKVPSGEITNKPFLQHIAGKKMPVILSTGMCTLDEIAGAIEVLRGGGLEPQDLYVLHCNTEYPTPMADVNLKAMGTIGTQLGVTVGYSDHTLGIEVAVAAVAMGANVIEKHFTLDKTLPGPDHQASLEPAELKAMVSAIRNIELAIAGSGIKEASASEKANSVVARRSIFLRHPLEAGRVIAAGDLEMKRPGDGISPMQMDLVVGKMVKTQLPASHKLSFNDLA